MATRLKEADAVMVGMGWTGAILARELTKAGLNVVGLERGADRKPAEEFTLTRLRDELRYVVRLELMQDNSIDTITFRNAPDEMALPIRRFGAFLPGEGVGGTGIHWGALHWRFLPTDFRIKSVLTEKYGAKAIPDTMTIQDWPVSYDELEPFYDRFDKLCGVSGQAGNLRGNIVAGGNPFEGARSDDYPNKSIKAGVGPEMFGSAAKSLGYHPFPLPVATGKGVVGKNYCYQFEAGGEAFFEGREFNPFMGAPGMSVAIDDFNGENFDHSGVGFFGGGYISCTNGGAPPIGGRALPRGEP